MVYGLSSLFFSFRAGWLPLVLPLLTDGLSKRMARDQEEIKIKKLNNNHSPSSSFISPNNIIDTNDIIQKNTLRIWTFICVALTIGPILFPLPPIQSTSTTLSSPQKSPFNVINYPIEFTLFSSLIFVLFWISKLKSFASGLNSLIICLTAVPTFYCLAILFGVQLFGSAGVWIKTLSWSIWMTCWLIFPMTVIYQSEMVNWPTESASGKRVKAKTSISIEQSSTSSSSSKSVSTSFSLTSFKKSLKITLNRVLTTCFINNPTLRTWDTLLTNSSSSSASFKSFYSRDSLVFYLIWCSGIGCWIGSWTSPLDWNRDWQKWPIPNVIGGVIGQMVGLMIYELIQIYSKYL